MLSKAWGHHGSSEVLGGEWRHLDPCPSSEWTWQVIRLSGLWFSQFQKNFVGFSDLRHWNLLPVTDCPQLKDNFWFPYSTPTSHLLFPEKKNSLAPNIWCHLRWGEELRDLLFRKTIFFTEIFLFKVVSVAWTAREDEGFTQKCQRVVVESGQK